MGANMHILKLSTYYDPELTAGSHLSKDLEEAYISAGYRITVIAPTPSRGIDDETRKKYLTKLYETKYDGKVTIIRFRMFRERKSTIQRAFRYFIIMIKQYFIARKIKGIDMIISGSTPPIQGLLVSPLKKKLKVPLIYVLQDIFPDSLLNTGIIKKKLLIWKIGRKIESYTYKNADKIIVISQDFKENIVKKGVPDNKIEIIPNWIDLESIRYIPRENNYIFDKFNIDRNRFIISYCGNIGLTQNIELVLRSAVELSANTNILFVLVGDGQAKERMEGLSRELSLENVVFLPFQPYEFISEVYSIGDIGLIVSKKNIGANSVPSKVFSMMAAEQLILASFDTNSELGELIDKAKCGYCIEPENLRSFIEKIQSIYRRKDTIHSLGKNGRLYAMNEHSKEKNTSKYVSLISSITKHDSLREKNR
jgi:glycosyltransferase involved in cell wall biosynthesis